MVSFQISDPARYAEERAHVQEHGSRPGRGEHGRRRPGQVGDPEGAGGARTRPGRIRQRGTQGRQRRRKRLRKGHVSARSPRDSIYARESLQGVQERKKRSGCRRPEYSVFRVCERVRTFTLVKESCPPVQDAVVFFRLFPPAPASAALDFCGFFNVALLAGSSASTSWRCFKSALNNTCGEAIKNWA